MPCFLSASGAIEASRSAKACSGSVAITIDDRESGFSNPGNRLLATKAGGGTNPMRDPSGNIGSAANAGARPRDTVNNRRNAMNRSIMSRFLRDRGEVIMCLWHPVLGVFHPPQMSDPYGHHRAKP